MLQIFLFFPFYFVCWIQIWNNLISQAGEMALHGTPNDLLQNLDPIALIIFIPFLDLVVYPALRKFKIDFDPISRIFAGFMLVSISMVYASVLQHYIYISPEKSIHVWIQAPAYVFVAFSEAFIIITGLELAFTQAPKKYVTSLLAYHMCIANITKSAVLHLRTFLDHDWYRSCDLHRAQPCLAGPVHGLDVCWLRHCWLCSWMYLFLVLSQRQEMVSVKHRDLGGSTRGSATCCCWASGRERRRKDVDS
jgi:hypothetical protein